MLRVTAPEICQFRIGTVGPLDNNGGDKGGEGAILKSIQDDTSQDGLAPGGKRLVAGVPNGFASQRTRAR